MAAGARSLMFQESSRSVFAHGKCRLSEGRRLVRCGGKETTEKKVSERWLYSVWSSTLGNSGFLGVGVTATNAVNRHFHPSGKEAVVPGRSRRFLRRSRRKRET